MIPLRAMVVLCFLVITAVLAYFTFEQPDVEHVTIAQGEEIQPLTTSTPHKPLPAEPASVGPAPVTTSEPLRTVDPQPEEPEADPSLTMKVYMPKQHTPRNGFIVLVPRKWRADQDINFNPLLPKYKASWVASLRKHQPEVIEIHDLPRDSYQLFVYRNDGGDNKAPTWVHIIDISSGGFCNLDDIVLNKLDPLN